MCKIKMNIGNIVCKFLDFPLFYKNQHRGSKGVNMQNINKYLWNERKVMTSCVKLDAAKTVITKDMWL